MTGGGFAGYGHRLELVYVNAGEEKESLFRLEGMVDDPSGGEAGGDFSLAGLQPRLYFKRGERRQQ